MDLHEHYDQLTEREREFVDDSLTEVFSLAKFRNIPFRGDDEAERVADALARLVIQSRRPFSEPPAIRTGKFHDPESFSIVAERLKAKLREKR